MGGIIPLLFYAVLKHVYSYYDSNFNFEQAFLMQCTCNVFNLIFLKGLHLRKCPVTDISMQLLAETASDMEELSVEITDLIDDLFTDRSVTIIAERMKNLRLLDLSWNLCMSCFVCKIV